MLLEEERTVKPHLTSLFEFESVKYITAINSDGQTNYKPIVTSTDDNKNKILKIIIPNDITSISYQVSDQTKTIKTDGKQTILFIKSDSKDNIQITTNKSSNLEFSLIPQAFAACDVDAVCYDVNYDNDDALSCNLYMAQMIHSICSFSKVMVYRSY